MASISLVSAQTKTASGTVKSAEDGLPIIGAGVYVKGSNQGVSTDMSGRYSISVPTSTQTLVVSFVGMKTVEVDAIQNVEVTLFPIETELGEIVVTAMGLKRSEKSLGYSASTVRNEEINSAKSSSMMTGLQGKVAGLSISQTGGTGTSQKVVIRGVSSFSGSNQPLYVVNGIPMQNDFQGNNGTNNSIDFGNLAADINPEDVESVTVLKGASATALYGSRAANGVIQITTKRGRSGEKLNVVFNGTVTASTVLRVPQTQ